MIFWCRLDTLVLSILLPICPPLGAQLGPKIAPKSLQEPSKTDPKSHLIFDLFFDRFFHWFFIDFRCQNRPKIYHKSIPKSSQEHINKKLKTSILYCNLQYIRALGYVMLCTKFNKKWYRNPFKNSSQINTKLGSILHPTWLHFGRFLEPKMEPNSLQIASKINLQIDHLMDSVSDRSWDRFCSILSPNLEPKTAQDPILKASWAILERKSEKNQTKMGPKLITFNQHDPKYPQSRPRTPPWTSFSFIFDWFFNRFLIRFSSIFVGFLIDFWSHFNWCFHVFDRILEPNVLHF